MDQYANWLIDSDHGSVFVSIRRQPLPGTSIESYDDVTPWAENKNPLGAVAVDFIAHFDWVLSHLPMVLGREVTFEKAVVYVQGVDAASDFLDGFHEWLVDRLGAGRSLYWSSLVRCDFFGIEPVHHSTDLPSDWKQRNIDQDAELVNHLFELITVFLRSQSFTWPPFQAVCTNPFLADYIASMMAFSVELGRMAAEPSSRSGA